MVKQHARAGKTPGPGEGKRGEGGHIAYLLRQANAATRLAMDRALADLDVTLPQFSALTMICAYEDLSNADLARLTLQTPQTTILVVRSLEQRGAIERLPHATHGRILAMRATAEGRRLRAKCRRRADTVERRLQACAPTPAENAAVRRFLTRAALAFAEEVEK